MAINCSQGLWHKGDVSLAVLGGVLLQKLLRQEDGIVSAVTQRRQTDYQYRQPKLQIFAK